MFSHFKKNNGNVIAVVSAKKGSTKEYLVSRYPEAQFPGFNAKGGIDTDKLKSLLVKDKKNFVIVESETTLHLNQRAWTQFEAILDNPRKATPALKALFLE